MFCTSIRRSLARALVLLCTVLLLPAVALAQGRHIRGTVFDRSSRPVEGAVVKLKNTITLQIRSYITQHNGQYRFHGLHPYMDYSVRARRDGDTSKTREITRFDSNPLIRIDLHLNIAAEDSGE
jgi:protocatechuate 3,4-dioxygenase beta subunit